MENSNVQKEDINILEELQSENERLKKEIIDMKYSLCKFLYDMLNNKIG